MGEGEYDSKVKKIVEKFEGVIDASESICKRIAEAECEMDKQRVKLLDKVEVFHGNRQMRRLVVVAGTDQVEKTSTRQVKQQIKELLLKL